jgi:hypothetical protein
VKLALALGLVAIAVAVAVVLSEARLTVLSASPVDVNRELTVVSHVLAACQSSETLPQGTVAMRLSISGVYGPKVTVTASSEAHVITAGERGSGWTADVVTVPVSRVSRPYRHVNVCFALERGAGVVRLDGQTTARSLAAHAGDGTALPGRVRIEYLGLGDSWWSVVPSVATHMGLGRATSGVWIVLIAIALMIAVAVLATVLALLELR